MSKNSNLEIEATQLEELTQDYTRQPVPPDVNANGIQVAVILCAIMITLPVLAYSSWLAQENTLGNANVAFWLGSALVAIISCVSGLVGSRSRLSTYMILQFSFGKTGAKVVNLLMVLILLGWYAATCEQFGIAISSALKTMFDVNFPVKLAVVIGSVLMTITTIFGFRAIEKFSRFSVPLLAGFMIYVAFQAGAGSENLDWSITASTTDTLSLSSIIIGLMIISAVLIPDFTRYCPNDKQVYIAALAGAGVTYPLVLLMAAIPAIRTGQSDLMLIMAGMGVVYIALFVLVFATWSTNITNLYSSTLTLSTFMTKTPSWQLTVGGSFIATIAAVAGITNYFTDFLLFIGVAATPLIGVYVVDFFFVKKGDYSLERLARVPNIGYLALIAWAVGSVVGFCTERTYFTMTYLSAIDALLTTAIVYFILCKVVKPAENNQ